MNHIKNNSSANKDGNRREIAIAKKLKCSLVDVEQLCQALYYQGKIDLEVKSQSYCEGNLWKIKN